MIDCPAMADFLSKEELQALSDELSKLSPWHVREFYQKVWTACGLAAGVPRPKVIQELVTAWKLLRKWK